MLAGYVVICAHYINISDINQIFNKQHRLINNNR